MLRSLRKLSVALLFAGSLPVLAAEGRIPIAIPMTINAPGKYFLVRDITGLPGASVISVAASGVDIDLNGFTLFVGGSGTGISITPSTSLERITIRNGKIMGGNEGILVAPAPQTMGVFFSQVVIELVKASGSTLVTGGGIHLTNASAVMLLHNSVTGPGGGSGGHGILLESCTACLVSENIITQTGGNGIRLDRITIKAKVFDNLISFTGPSNDGIFISSDSFTNLVLNNIVGGASRDGLHVEGSRNHIDRNVLNGSGGYGLMFSASSHSNTFGRNTARWNTGATNTECEPLFPPESCDLGMITAPTPDPMFAGRMNYPNTTFGDNLVPGGPPY